MHVGEQPQGHKGASDGYEAEQTRGGSLTCSVTAVHPDLQAQTYGCELCLGRLLWCILSMPLERHKLDAVQVCASTR